MNEKEYSVHELSELSGVSVRILHYYNQRGLLPACHKENNYRSYGTREVDLLHQILLYKEFGMELAAIKEILDQPDFDSDSALKEHLSKIKEQRQRFDMLISGVEKVLDEAKGGSHMSDEEKFEGFKKQLIEENEQIYGSEIREKYGSEEVDASNAKLMGLTKQDFERSQTLEEEMKVCLLRAMTAADPAGSAAQKACDLHRKWLNFFWQEGLYNKQAHLGLAEMYVADARFRAYYDAWAPGATQFLREALHFYCAT